MDHMRDIRDRAINDLALLDRAALDLQALGGVERAIVAQRSDDDRIEVRLAQDALDEPTPNLAGRACDEDALCCGHVSSLTSEQIMFMVTVGRGDARANNSC